MKYYAGLDVSLKDIFVSIIDEKGKLVEEFVVVNDPEVLSQRLNKFKFKYELLGIESGQLSIWLCKSLKALGFPAICVDARHMAAALSARVNKNDKNDARGIAQMIRTGLYREVQVKSDEGCAMKVLLGSRRRLVEQRKQMMGTIRGLLKIYGIRLGSKAVTSVFISRVRDAVSDLDEISKLSIEALLESLETIGSCLDSLSSKLTELAKEDDDCQRLMTIPGVGAVTSMTYKTALDDPHRFDDSETVGAYMGLTPRQYSSGEINRHGRISRMGPKECRHMLYEAAQALLTRSQDKSTLKAWGMRLAKKKGMRKATIAVARKMAVIMHRMMIDKTEFCHTKK